MSTVAAPVVGSPVPLASVATTLMTQVAREGTAGFWIASGGPNKQFSTGWQAPAVPPQSASVRQVLCGLGPLQAPTGGQSAAVVQGEMPSWHNPQSASVMQGVTPSPLQTPAAQVPLPPAVQVPGPKQSESLIHVAPGLAPPTHFPALTHSFAVVLDPLVQSSLPVPLLATSAQLGAMSR